MLGDTFAFESLPEFETLLTTSPTLREALRVADLARRMVLPWLKLEVKEEGDLARVEVGFDVPVPNLNAYGLPLHLVSEAILACIRKFGRTLQGSEDGFVGVSIKGPPPFLCQQIRVLRTPGHLQRGRRCADLRAPHPRPAARRRFPSLARAGPVPGRAAPGQGGPPRQGVAAEIEELITREPNLLALGV